MCCTATSPPPRSSCSYCATISFSSFDSGWDTENGGWKPVPGLDPSAGAGVEELVVGAARGAEEEDSLGPLDLRVRMVDSFEAAMAAVRGVSELMSTSEEADRQWTARVQAATASRVNPKDAQALINGKAADFGKRARELQSLRGTFRTASDEFSAL